jgi:hypothetical protein
MLALLQVVPGSQYQKPTCGGVSGGSQNKCEAPCLLHNLVVILNSKMLPSYNRFIVLGLLPAQSLQSPHCQYQSEKLGMPIREKWKGLAVAIISAQPAIFLVRKKIYLSPGYNEPQSSNCHSPIQL